MEKYRQALSQFSEALKDTSVTQITTQILAKHGTTNNTPKVYECLYSCLDLTSLNPTDSKESIWKMVEKVNMQEENRPDISNVAAICVYPNFITTVKEALTAPEIKVAAVSGGFPASQTFMEIKIAETALAVSDGADEIDIVINLGAFFENDYETMCEEIQEIKDSCGEATLKVILETGLLKTAQSIKYASILAIFSGADFLKTSTGKNCEGATPEAVYTMCETIREYYALHNKKIGIKIAGGIRTVEDAVKYYTVVKDVLGEEWLTPEYFRIGASSLADNLLQVL